MVEHSLRIAMYPWFAMGHFTAFLHISNKLAQRGHRIFFILPTKAQSKLAQSNLHPDLIEFIPITVPHADGLPRGAETTADLPSQVLRPALERAFHETEPVVGTLLQDLKPHLVFFDFAHWLPPLARSLGIKSVHYCTISPAASAYMLRQDYSRDALKTPPDGFPPSSALRLHTHEARFLSMINSDPSGMQRLIMAIRECDATGFKSCREMEGPYHEYLEKKFKKPVLLAGPALPETPAGSSLDERWAKWLDQFEPRSVVFCCFGSEARLPRDRFQELLLGFELTELPFLVALKPPVGAETVEDALPEGFRQRTEKRGVVYGGWVQQPLILSHPSVGCFVTHCGWGSLSEAMLSECQLVLMPRVIDQPINARFVGGDLRIGVEVEKGDEDGLFTREGVCKAIREVMDEESEIGNEVRANHTKWREFLLREGLEDSYIDEFVDKLQRLLEH